MIWGMRFQLGRPPTQPQSQPCSPKSDCPSCLLVEGRLRDRHALCQLSPALSQFQVICQGNRLNDAPGLGCHLQGTQTDSETALPQDGALSLNVPLPSLEGCQGHGVTCSASITVPIAWNFSMQKLFLHVRGGVERMWHMMVPKMPCIPLYRGGHCGSYFSPPTPYPICFSGKASGPPRAVLTAGGSAF